MAVAIADTLLLLLLCVFIFVSPFSKPAVKILLGIMSGTAIFVSLLRRQSKSKFPNLIPKNLLNSNIFIFLSAMILSTIFSINIGHSQRIIFERYIPYILFFMLGSFIVQTNKRSLLIICIALTLLGITLSIGGISDYICLRSYGRLYTAFRKDVILSNFLVIMMPFFCVCASLIKNKLLRAFSVLGLLSCLPIFVLNGSRGAWFAVILVVLAVILVKKTEKFPFWFISIIAILIIIPSFLRDRFFDLLSLDSWGGRPYLYKTACRIFLDFPVLGSGPGTFEKLLYLFGPVGGYPECNMLYHLHAHNTFLEVLSETGIIGFVAFCSIFVSFITLFFKSSLFSKKNTNDQDVMIIGLVTGIIATLIFANGSSIITLGMQDAAMFWFLLGVTSGGISQKINQRQNKN